MPLFDSQLPIPLNALLYVFKLEAQRFIDLLLKFIDFPEDLNAIMNGHTAVIYGGLQMQVAVP